MKGINMALHHQPEAEVGKAQQQEQAPLGSADQGRAGGPGADPEQKAGWGPGMQGGGAPHPAWAHAAAGQGPAQAGYAGAAGLGGGYAGAGFHGGGYGPGPNPYYQGGYMAPPMYPGHPHGGHGAYAAWAAAQPGAGNGLSDLVGDALKGDVDPSKLGRYLDDGAFIKGALVGAAVVLLLTDNPVRRALFSGTAKATVKVKEGLDQVKQAVGGKAPGVKTTGSAPEPKSD
jgi:hypothetical protein